MLCLQRSREVCLDNPAGEEGCWNFLCGPIYFFLSLIVQGLRLGIAQVLLGLRMLVRGPWGGPAIGSHKEKHDQHQHDHFNPEKERNPVHKLFDAGF